MLHAKKEINRPMIVSRVLLAKFVIFLVMINVSGLALEAATRDHNGASYRELVGRVKSGDFSVDFRLLRLACLTDEACDPRGDSKDLMAARRAMQSTQYKEGAKIAERLIDKGFVNIEAHAICSRAYEELRNPEKAKFHHDVATCLMRSILSTGDGKTRETAFEVIGTFEEYVVMSVLGLPRLGSQSLVPGKPHNYDVLKVKDPRTGQEVSVYFNIDAFYPPKGL